MTLPDWDGATAIDCECAAGHIWLASGWHQSHVTYFTDGAYGTVCPECGQPDVHDEDPQQCPDVYALRTQYTKENGIWKHQDVINMERFDRELYALLDTEMNFG